MFVSSCTPRVKQPFGDVVSCMILLPLLHSYHIIFTFMFNKICNMSCQVCQSERNCTIRRNIYKCPRCLIRYCSVNCWKKHKEDNCLPLLNNNKSNKNQSPEKLYSYNYKTESSVPIEKLKLLEGSKELKTVLSNPHVRNMILAINKSENPAKSMQHAMLEPIFVEFADECLRIVEPPSDP